MENGISKLLEIWLWHLSWFLWHVNGSIRATYACVSPPHEKCFHLTFMRTWVEKKCYHSKKMGMTTWNIWRRYKYFDGYFWNKSFYSGLKRLSMLWTFLIRLLQILIQDKTWTALIRLIQLVIKNKNKIY